MIELNKKNFKKEVSSGLVLVDFWAPRCMPCSQLMPELEELSAMLKHVKFAQLNVDKEAELTAEHNVIGLPSLVLFRDGNEVTRIVGRHPREKLREKIISAIGY